MDTLIASFISIFIKEGQITALTISAVNSGILLWMFRYHIHPHNTHTKSTMADIDSALSDESDKGLATKKGVKDLDKKLDKVCNDVSIVSEKLTWMSGTIQALGVGSLKELR